MTKEYSRREFLKKARKASLAATLGFLLKGDFGESNVASQPSGFERGYTLNTKSLEKIAIESEKLYTPTEQEKIKFFRQLATGLKRQGIPYSSIEFVKALKRKGIRLEPDHKYASQLIKEAEKSIDHMFDFLNSSHIPKQRPKFIVPTSKQDINSEETNKFLIYLVADLGKMFTFKYQVVINGKEPIYEIDGWFSDYGSADVTFNVVTTQNGFEINGIKNQGIIYRTTSPLVELVETPAIEVMHRSVQKFSHNHLNKAVKNIGRNTHTLNKVISLHINREERFVHALSILWLKQYNQERKIGLTEEQLNKRFSRYEIKGKNFAKYNGANKLSQYIQAIGINKAIDLYVNNPNELFKVIEK